MYPPTQASFPRLATTHTCRDFGKIQNWARDNAATGYDWAVTPDQAEGIIADSGFDHSPWEDIEFLWERFPGNKFFKHWRDHPFVAE